MKTREPRWAVMLILYVPLVLLGCKGEAPGPKITSLSNEQLQGKLKEMHAKAIKGKLRLGEVRSLLGDSTVESRQPNGAKFHEWQLPQKDVIVRCEANILGEVSFFEWESISGGQALIQEDKAAEKEREEKLARIDAWLKVEREALKTRYVAKIRTALGMPADTNTAPTLPNGRRVDRAYCQSEIFQNRGPEFDGVPRWSDTQDLLGKIRDQYVIEREALDSRYSKETQALGSFGREPGGED